MLQIYHTYTVYKKFYGKLKQNAPFNVETCEKQHTNKYKFKH